MVRVMKRRRPRIHQSMRTKRPARRARERHEAHCRRVVRYFAKNGVHEIDPTVPIRHTFSFSVYEP